MPNEQKLKPIRTESEARKKGRNGGIASGIARREKKTVQKILGDFLDLGITQNRTLEALARKAGLSTDGSIKDLVTAVCVLNTLKKGDISELEKIAKLLGEQTEIADTEAQKQAAFLDAVKKAVTDAD